MISKMCFRFTSVSRSIFSTATATRTPGRIAHVSLVPSRQVSHVGLRQRSQILTTSNSIRNSWIQTRCAQSEADQAMSEYLASEIKMEKEMGAKGKGKESMPGWETECNGCNVILKKMRGDETITVKFNVNHSVDSNFDDTYSEEGDVAEKEEEPELVSRPMFSVELSKGGTILQMTCVFSDANEPIEPDQTEEDVFEDAFSIDDVALLRQGESNSEAVYSLTAGVMDADVYQLLMNMLDERDIGEQFAQDLQSFATAYEHKQYISFLEGLKAFASK
ncbi:complement component 1 Q subcomponent-binding protein, mitochondrial-like isoform X1 [Lingula anatina]|uniref:Complement component 1 Q subcomponent-binding protein, mitochondrial-like isoform X1 n=1 Tax=Lingula anatina TaxID=7574 RepID=A0A1S3HH18_LINAN|nr:complement component 1 Q subcomponent-binding protein, mitochondrial-like isoform X1 [Lingula anatina]|eukprot:XP_013385378.1 complement component 1 Q subcomponent-binding protein, mitochondrial-like isoform X1 [Lingula anatina]